MSPDNSDRHKITRLKELEAALRHDEVILEELSNDLEVRNRCLDRTEAVCGWLNKWSKSPLLYLFAAILGGLGGLSLVKQGFTTALLLFLSVPALAVIPMIVAYVFLGIDVLVTRLKLSRIKAREKRRLQELEAERCVEHSAATSLPISSQKPLTREATRATESLRK